MANNASKNMNGGGGGKAPKIGGSGGGKAPKTGGSGGGAKSIAQAAKGAAPVLATLAVVIVAMVAAYKMFNEAQKIYNKDKLNLEAAKKAQKEVNEGVEQVKENYN
jgi:hypothetical protein